MVWEGWHREVSPYPDQPVFSAPPRPSFRDLSVDIVRRDAALKTLCILENSGRFVEDEARPGDFLPAQFVSRNWATGSPASGAPI